MENYKTRAKKAAKIFKKLYSAEETEKGIRFSNGRYFSQRALDDCFENGDGAEVSAELVRMAKEDFVLKQSLFYGLGRNFSASEWRDELTKVEKS